MSARRPLHSDQSEDEEATATPGQTSNKVTVKPCSNYSPSMDFLALPWHASMVLFYSLLLYHGIRVRHSNQHILDPTGKIPQVGGLFKYLTHINQWFQLFFFSFQLLTDLTPCQYKAKLQKISSFMFTVIAFPCSALVCSIFWGIYAVDRKYIYPEVFDKFVPGYLNHFWHTTILLWVLCEIYLVRHEFPTTPKAGVAIFLGSSLYIAWLFYIFVTTGWWVYPILKVLPPAMLSIFLAACIFCLLGLHLLGKLISNIRWGEVASVKEVKHD